MDYGPFDPVYRRVCLISLSLLLIFGSGCGTGRASGAPQAGPAGATGPQGPAGPAGAPGPPGPAGMTFRGPWSESATYAATDSVTFSGSTYIATAVNTGMEPDRSPASWSVLAQAGAPGTAAAVSIGTVTTVGPSSPASVTNSGTATVAVLNFAIPQGVPGAVAGTQNATGAGNIAAPLLNALGAVNLFDYTKITPNAILNPDGTLASAGANSGLYTSDFMLCAGLSAIALNVNAGHGLAFYDANQSFISFFPSGLTSAAVPANAVFFRFSTSGDPSSVVAVAGTSTPSAYVPYGATNAALAQSLEQVPKVLGPLAGKNLGVFGDSIVAASGTTWMPTVQTRTNATFTFVDGVGGRETRYAFSNYNNGAAAPGDGSGTSPAGHTLAQDLAGVDLLLIELGTNDGGQYRSINLGSPTDAPSMNPAATLSSNIAGVITTVLAAKPTLRVVWMTPWQDNPINGHGGCDSVACSTAVTKAIIDVCQAYAIPVINMLTESGINSSTWTSYLVDGLHPSQTGGEKVIGPLVGQKLNLFY